MADYKLIGHNYQTPDIVAKVTGRAKYAEDYRADGMLFVKLLLSPMPHARVRNIDATLLTVDGERDETLDGAWSRRLAEQRGRTEQVARGGNRRARGDNPFNEVPSRDRTRNICRH